MPNIAGLEIYLEQGGPTLRDLLQVLRGTLEKSRLILHLDYCFEQLPEVLRKLPREGLFLAISNLRIRSDAEFRRFHRRPVEVLTANLQAFDRYRRGCGARVQQRGLLPFKSSCAVPVVALFHADGAGCTVTDAFLGRKRSAIILFS